MWGSQWRGHVVWNGYLFRAFVEGNRVFRAIWLENDTEVKIYLLSLTSVCDKSDRDNLGVLVVGALGVWAIDWSTLLEGKHSSLLVEVDFSDAAE